MAGSLLAALTKWDNARLHQAALARQLPVEEHPVTAKAYRGGLEYRFYLGEIPPFDPKPWALGAGDCLFNLRAALDHLVYQLHVRRYRGKVPDAAARQSAFPIFTEEELRRQRRPLDTTKWKEIKRLSIKQRRAIQFLQPYNGRNDASRYMRDALAQINRLNNIDKHRHLHVVRRAVTSMPWPRFPPEYGFVHTPFWITLKGNAEVFRWEFSKAPPDIAKRVEMHHYVTAQIMLQEDDLYIDLVRFLQQFVELTEIVIKRFDVFLPFSE
jgi:hypothetical protein